MTGVAALAICAAFTSCSKSEELYDSGQITRNEAVQIEENYNRAFIATFGQPAANQDWGFGSSAGTRSITVNGDVYNKFPSAGDVAAYFPTSIPADAKTDAEIEAEWKGKYAVDENGEEIIAWGNKVQMWDLYAIYLNMVGKVINNIEVTAPGEYEVGHSWANPADRVYNVYINVGDGNSLTLKRNGAEHVNFYIMSGNVTIDSNFGECGGVISVAEGATVNDQRTHIAHNDGIKVFNKGTYNATKTSFDIGNFCTFYNEGTFNCSGAMSYSPGDANDSYFINMGDDAVVTAASMTLNSAGNFFNSGTANISGETFVTQKDIYWVNAGHYTTGSMTFSAKNATFYNYCQLIVLGNAHMYDGEFNLMENSYTEAGSGEFDNFIVNMGSNTGMHIKGAVKFEAQGDGTYQGFRTSGSNDYVLIDGKVTVACHRNTFSISSGITYSINQIEIVRGGAVVTEAQLQDEQSGDYPVLDLNGTECEYGKLTVTPSTTSCGATDSQATSDWEEGSDWDFNDVVFDVKFTSQTTAIVKIVGAGGRLPLYVAGHEAHQELGQSGPDSNGVYMIQSPRRSTPFEVTGIDKTQNGRDIVVKVVRKSSSGEDIISELVAEVGKPAAKIGVDPKFEPCAERQDIRKKYPLFSEWVKKGGSLAWYKVN